jgi:hypothetical protein
MAPSRFFVIVLPPTAFDKPELLSCRRGPRSGDAPVAEKRKAGSTGATRGDFEIVN